MIKFDFSKDEYEFIIEKAMLKDDERKLDKILEYKIKGWSRVKIADAIGITPEGLDKRMIILKNKIQKVIQKYYK